MYGMNLSEITVTNRYGYAILTDGGSGKAMVCEPTMAGPDIIAFVIVERCDDYATAHLVALMLHENGIHPSTYEPEENDGQEPVVSVPLALAGPTTTAPASAATEQG
jgi:hypothetical protein